MLRVVHLEDQIRYSEEIALGPNIGRPVGILTLLHANETTNYAHYNGEQIPCLTTMFLDRMLVNL